ncbi:MAG TPA: DEAD/DEAH box helicase family protein [Nitrososphaeraceae archaeon]|nr:DEAD/DEAH box helicase family protein [Nitrososphaeraceae archaeon]HSL12886.1 DEAD/DEAH box helicase family protein [Nitrososphaeraceae archaeon]
MSEIMLLKFPFELKKDQRDAVDEWINKKGKGSIIYSTGTGKTEIAFECARKMASLIRKQNPLMVFKILFLVPRIVLIQQNINRLIKYGIKKEKIGVYYGEKKDIKEITFSTYQSIIKNFDLLRQSDMIILDEMHMVSETAKKLSKIFDVLYDNYDKLILGLTATIDENDPRYSKIMKLIPPVKKYMIKEAVNDGRLSEPLVILKPVKMNSEEQRIYEQTTSTIKDISLKLKASNPLIVSKLLKTGGQRARLAKLWFASVHKRKKLLNETNSKLNESVNIVKSHPKEKIMIFSETIESINNISEILKKNKIPSQVIHNKIKTKQRQDILDSWGRNYFVLLSVHTLEIGFDIPSVSIAIIVSNTKNVHQLVQRIGRVIRKTDEKNQSLIYVVYVDDTKDKNILNLVRTSLQSNSIKKPIKQDKISSYF